MKRLLVYGWMSVCVLCLKGGAIDVSYKKSDDVCIMESIDGIERLFVRSVSEMYERMAVVKKAVQEHIETMSLLTAGQRTFANTIQVYDDTYKQVLLLQASLEAVEAVYQDRVMRDSATKALIDLAQFTQSMLTKNKAIYEAFKAYRDGAMVTEVLDDEQKAYVREVIHIFELDGLNLPTKKRARVRQLVNEITQLTLQFGKNINEDDAVLRFAKAELDGVPDYILDGLTIGDKNIYTVGLDFPTVTAILNHARIEHTRKRVYESFFNKAYPKNDKIVARIIILRQELAHTLGFSSYVDYALAHEMVGTPQAAENFLRTLHQKLEQKVQQEFTDLLREVPAECVLSADRKLQPWDVAYVQQKYKQKYLHVDDRVLMEYFPVEHVLHEVFGLFQDFFGVRFEFLPHISVWSADVYAVEVRDVADNRLRGYLLLDLYQRAGKYSSASEMELVCAQLGKSRQCPAAVLLIANAPQRVNGKPGLLSLEDVATLLHELGHVMHAMFNQTRMYAFASVITKLDFVEMPSQLFERVLYDKTILKRISKHWQTGQSLPDAMIDSLVQLEQFDAGYWHRNYVGRSLFLLKLYAEKKPDVRALCRQYMDGVAGDYVAWDDDIHFSSNFLHMADYGPKYYSYLWSKVFAADVYETIKERGGFTAAVGKRFVDEVLSKGGSVDPQQLLEAFLSRKPNEQAFLASVGANELV